MDHQMFVESVNPDSPAFSGDVRMPYIDLSSGEFADLSLWNSGEPSSSRHSINNGAREETRMEHGWSSSLTINGNSGSRTQERQFETTNMFLGSRLEEGRLDASPLENLNLNLSSNQLNAGDQSFSQNPRVLENSVPFVPASFESVHVPCSSGTLNRSVSSSRDAESLTERCLSCKRKSIEGVSSHSSGSGSSSLHYQGENSLVHTVSAHQSANTTLGISGPSNYSTGTHPHPCQEHLSPRIATNLNIGVSHLHPYNVMGNVEGSHRNRRIRISPEEHLASPPDQWPPGNNHWSMQQASNLFIPFNQPVESSAVVASGTSNRQPPASSVPPLVQNVRHLPVNLASSSRTDSSSRSPAIAVQRSIAPRNSILGHSVLAPPSEMRHLIQHSSSWTLAPAYQVGTNTQAVQSSVPTLNPPHNIPIQYQQVLPEASRQSLIPFVRSVSSQGQSINVSPQTVASSNTFQEIRDQQIALLRGIQQSHMRPANNVLGDPSLRAVRDSRNRVLSEQIRNMLARRGDHIQLQGMLLFDRAVIYGRATELHDRHRDMRLDVDNMSYEELLALEERIGNVNTGLSEEKILKRLKRRKYISLSEEPPSEVEPCCICQEEYVEEEDVGRLDCGHDFHTACIKQWLMSKNLCPICRTTGLVI